MSKLQLSARAYHRTRSVKLARTIADLAGSEKKSIHTPGGGVAVSSEVDVGIGAVKVLVLITQIIRLTKFLAKLKPIG